jgi:hypothetical protein
MVSKRDPSQENDGEVYGSLTWEALDTESSSKFTSNAIGVSFGDNYFILHEVRIIDPRNSRRWTYSWESIGELVVHRCH